MPLTPIDVQQKTFGPELRGYNMDEVDDFLDEVVATLKDYDQRMRDAQDRIRALEAELASRGEEETAISRALVAAQKQADAIIAEAQAEAERIRQSAQGEADRLRAERDAERQRLTQEIARMRATVADLKRRIVGLAAAAEANLDSMDAAIAEATTDIGAATPVFDDEAEEAAAVGAGSEPAEAGEPEEAAEIGDWGATSDDYAEPESDWEEEAAEAAEEGWGGYGDYADVPADAPGDDSPEDEPGEPFGPEQADDGDTVDGDAYEEPTAELAAEQAPATDPDAAVAEEDQGDFGTLAERMAREASRANLGSEDTPSGRRPWERGSV